MKNLIKLSLQIAAICLLSFACKPDPILEPRGDYENTIGFAEDPDSHIVPTPICNSITSATLVAVNNPNPATAWGSVEFTNTDKVMIVSVIAAIPIHETRVWIGPSTASPPLSGSQLDLASFPYQSSLNTGLFRYTFQIPLEQVHECNNVVVWADLIFGDGMGNIWLQEQVTAIGSPVPNSNAFSNAYCNSLQLCTVYDFCERWIDASTNPCSAVGVSSTSDASSESTHSSTKSSNSSKSSKSSKGTKSTKNSKSSKSSKGKSGSSKGTKSSRKSSKK